MDERESHVTLRRVFLDLAKHPAKMLLWHWNWKSALMSALIRGSLFFGINSTVAFEAAVNAFLTEAIFRVATAGFYGALTQAFRRVEPEWRGTLAAMILLPLVSHTGELAVHWVRGTPKLVESVLTSVVFTMCSTAFNLFAMRRGAFIVGEGSASLASDLRRFPLLFVGFIGLLGQGSRALSRSLAARLGRPARRLVASRP